MTQLCQIASEQYRACIIRCEHAFYVIAKNYGTYKRCLKIKAKYMAYVAPSRPEELLVANRWTNHPTDGLTNGLTGIVTYRVA